MKGLLYYFFLSLILSACFNHKAEQLQKPVVIKTPKTPVEIDSVAIVPDQKPVEVDIIDQQIAELKSELKDARVVRLGDDIKITFNSQILFEVDSDEIGSHSGKVLNDLSRVLNKYDGTLIEVAGHTDNTGDEKYNERLSRRRAAAVARYAVKQGVNPTRFRIQGYGESMPVASNKTEEGRSLNRRVELSIKGNQLKNKTIAGAYSAIRDSSCYCYYDQWQNYICRRLCESWSRLPESSVSFDQRVLKNSAIDESDHIFVRMATESDSLGTVEMESNLDSDAHITDALMDNSAKITKNDSDKRFLYSYDGNDKTKRQNLAATLEENDAVIMVGKVKDGTTNEPMGAKVRIKSADTGEEITQVLSDPLTGQYSILLEKGKEYFVSVESNGYLLSTEKLVVPDMNGYTVIREEFDMNPLKKGQKMNLSNVFFEQSKAVLLEKSFESLMEVVELMRANPTLEIELHGHTDGIGDAQLNMQLSRDRVHTIRNFMVNEGVNPKRISVKAFGGTKPIASNETEETRKLNRRVEFIILNF